MRLLLIISLLLANNVYGFNSKADFAYLIDATTGQEILSKKADRRMYPSSLTKIMTAYILFDAIKSGSISLDDKFSVSKKAWKRGGSSMFLEPRQKVKVEDLIKGLLVQSGNDAAITIAENIAGTEEAFAEIMNKFARNMGMNNSNFVNASGWPDDNHYTTPKDIVKLVLSLIRDFPQMYKFFSIESFSYNNIKQRNRNWLLGSYNGADGVTTGYSSDAGYALLASAKRNNRRLIAVVNGLDSKKERVNEARKLLDYGFNNFRNVQILSELTPLKRVKVLFGEYKTVNAGILEDYSLTIANDDKITLDIEYKTPLKAPIIKNEVIGNISINKNGKLFKYMKLYSKENIDEIGYFDKLIEYPKYYLNKIF